jgi:hypothetical protein
MVGLLAGSVPARIEREDRRTAMPDADRQTAKAHRVLGGHLSQSELDRAYAKRVSRHASITEYRLCDKADSEDYARLTVRSR